MEPRLTRHDDVIVLDLGDGENRFNPASISRLAEAVDEIDEIAAAGDKVGLVTTGSTEVGVFRRPVCTCTVAARRRSSNQIGA
jgi:hypothetical protein